MMHQPVEDNRILLLALATQKIASSLTMRQATYILQVVGDSHKDEFFVTVGQRVFGSCMAQEARLHPNAPLNNVTVIFEGGPTGHAKFKAQLSTFVADRLLLAMRTLGKDTVCGLMDACLAELEAPFDADDEMSDEWSDIACAERYAG
jgi:hypothetical protein